MWPRVLTRITSRDHREGVKGEEEEDEEEEEEESAEEECLSVVLAVPAAGYNTAEPGASLCSDR